MSAKQVFRGFSKGMSSLTFFPDIPRREVSPAGAWAAVGGAFQSAGNSIRKAIPEQPAPARKTAK
jgi:hypothetical protein